MRLSQTLWREARATALQCLEQPFVQGLGDGSLPSERYRTFIAQDAFFLEVFARGYAYCADAVPDAEGRDRFAGLLGGVSWELDLHRVDATELGIDLDHVQPIPSTLEYTRFLEDCIRSNAGPAITVASMTPCMRLYAYLGQTLARGGSALGPYSAWLETYASEEMATLARSVEDLLDRYADPPGEREREQYHRAMDLEYAFFDGVLNEAIG